MTALPQEGEARARRPRLRLVETGVDPRCLVCGRPFVFLSSRPDRRTCSGNGCEQELRRREEAQEGAAACEIIFSMSDEQRTEYEVEGSLPIIAVGLVMEDLDPTPVPQGCPRCWERDCSDVCLNCPDFERADREMRRDPRSRRWRKRAKLP